MRFISGALLIVFMSGCIFPQPGPLARFEFVEPHMATPCEIKFYARDPAEAERAKTEAYAEIAAIDRAMNDWDPSSEISRLGASSGGGEEVPVSERLFEVLRSARRYSDLSGGAFDVTVGPVVKLWRRARTERRMPNPAELRRALDAVGYRSLVLDERKHTARLEKPGISLDVGGIAKGYACDRALEILARHGITRAMVNTGGGMALGDPPPDQAGWRIQLADTEDVLVLTRCGVATSGDWERFVVIDGKRFSHVVDPATGLGLTNCALCTVVAPTGIAADALTKCVMIPGPDRGLATARSLPGTQAWMRWEEGGRTRTAQTPGFQALLAQN